MASPSAPIPPVPTRRRSISGPLVLIAVGVFFLLWTSRAINPVLMYHWFAHWWPLLLIVWGVIRLFEYYSDTQHGYPARRLGGGAIFLLIVFILFGWVVTKTQNVNWDNLRNNMQIGDDSDWGVWFGGPTYSFSNSVQQALPNNASVRVVSDQGDVIVNVWDENTIKVDAAKKIRTESNTDSNKLNEETMPTISVAGNTVTVNANTAGAGSNVNVRSDLQIWVPAKVPVDIATRRGDITVKQRSAGVKASNSKGSMTVEDVEGNVQLDERGKGDIHVARVTGDVTVTGQVDDTTISDVTGNVKLTGDYYGEMQLSKLAKGFSFRSSRTELELAKLDGDLNMDPGDLRATNIVGPMRVVTKATDIHLDGISGGLRVENTNGDIDVHSSNLGPIEIQDSTGDVRLVLPRRAGFQADVRTGNGDVSSEFESLKIESQNGGGRATGLVGNGGPTVKVTTEHGNIEVNKGGAEQS